jgi:anti-sigma factor RsiW
MKLLWGRRRDLVCQQAVELVTDYLEGKLRRAERRRFETHLSGCPNCTEYVAQLRETIRLTGLIGQAASEDLPPQLRDDLVQLYRQWKAEEQ